MILREYIQYFLDEYWSEHLDKVMEPPNDRPFDNEEEIDDNSMNPYASANDELRKVKAFSGPKTQSSQGAGMQRGSGPMTGRHPGGKRQGFH